MVSIIALLREHFAFTTTRNKEVHYYERPIFQSTYFRSFTTAIVCAEIIGTYLCARYWSALPWMSRLFLIVTLLSLVGAWVRAIANHRKMRERFGGLDLTGLPSELLKEAAGETNFGLALLSSITLILIFAWAFTIAHYEIIISKVCHGALR